MSVASRRQRGEPPAPDRSKTYETRVAGHCDARDASPVTHGGSACHLTPAGMLALQSTVGNRAVARLLTPDSKPAVGTVQRQDDSGMTPAHAGGAMGELDAAFGLGGKGFDVILGPGGSMGHKLTEQGLDIVAHNPKTGELWIVDNKASGGTSTVQSASAIIDNLKHNLGKAIDAVEKLSEFPSKKAVLAKLRATHSAVASGHKLPTEVKVVVTNAGGYHSGISKKLAKKGIKFVDLTGKAAREARKADIRKAKAAGASPGRPTTRPEPSTAPKPTGSPAPTPEATTPKATEATSPKVTTPKATEATSPKVTAPKARIPGGATRTVGTGIKVLGAIGTLQMIISLRDAFAGLGPQVELEGLDPGDFEVDHEITDIYVGRDKDGAPWYIDVRVARNIIFRKKFYIVKAYWSA